MIELSEEWLNDVARRAADDEETWCTGRPAWLGLEDEPSAIIDEPASATEADRCWAARFPALAKRRSRADMRHWREVGARQPILVFPLFAAGTKKRAA